jgi:hypothetical protein
MPAKAVAIVCLFAALALAAWFGLRGGGDTGLTPPTPPTAPAAEKPAGGGADLASGSVGRETATQPNVERTAVAVADPTKASGAAGSVGKVHGRIVDSNKAPRAGVKLEVDSWQNPDGMEINMGPGDNRDRGSARPKVTTAADGTFEFTLAMDRGASLELIDDTLVFANERPYAQGSKGDQDLGDIVAVISARISGVVQDERGQPVANVKVQMQVGTFGFGMGSDHTSTTDAAGRFQIGKLRPGKWTLRTASGQFLPTIEEVTLKAEEQRADLVLVVKPGQAIVGQVLDDRGAPVAGCKVGSKRKEARGAVSIERFTPDEATTTDTGGFFTLAGLSGDAVTVRAFGEGYTSAVAQDVAIGTGDLLLRVERLAVVEGVLQGMDGTPIAGSRVRAVPDRGSAGGESGFVMDDIDGLPMGDGGAMATTAADGSFRIKNVRPGTVAVAAEGKTHRPVRQGGVKVPPAQTIKGVRLLADLGAAVKVLVVDGTGKPVAGAKVRADRPKPAGVSGGAGMFVARRVTVEAGDDNEPHFVGPDEALGTAESNAEGVALITGLPQGPAELRAEHADFAAAEPVTVTLPKAGTIEARTALRTPGFVDVTVLGVDGSPAASSNFRLEGPEGDSKSIQGTSDTNGLAHMGPLTPGQYTASLVREVGGTTVGGATFVFGGDEGSAIAGSERQFSVVAGKTVALELRRPLLTKVFGTVTGVDGPVAGCHVEISKSGQEGDLGLPGISGERSVTADGEGNYAIEDVEAGDYVLQFGKPDQVVKAKARIHVQGDAAEQRQDLQLRTGKVRIQLWNELAGEPIEGAEVELREASTDSGARPQRRMMVMSLSTTDGGGGEATTMTVGGQHARSGADGWAEVDDVPAGNYDVSIKHDKYAPAEKKAQLVVERQTTDCGRVSMAQAGRIRGTVIGADGKQARMALVFYRAVGSEQPTGEPKPAMNGNFKIEALAPGRYLLKAQPLNMGPGGPGGPGASGPEVEVEVKAGETATAELHLPAK